MRSMSRLRSRSCSVPPVCCNNFNRALRGLIWINPGVVIAMILGRYLLHRRYTSRQVVRVGSFCLIQVPDPFTRQLAVLLVSIGVSIASISTSSSSSTSMADLSTTYLYGILMLIASLFATAILGILQERTYRAYGPCWREGMFYTVRELNLDPFCSAVHSGFSISSRCPSLYSSVTIYIRALELFQMAQRDLRSRYLISFSL
jgi:hypothetical protein